MDNPNQNTKPSTDTFNLRDDTPNTETPRDFTSEKYGERMQAMTEDLKERAKRATSDARITARRYASEAGRMSSEYYDQANAWVRENRRTTWLAVGALAALGVAGFLFSRSRRSEYDQY